MRREFEFVIVEVLEIERLRFNPENEYFLG
jgi:hypothetical protein